MQRKEAIRILTLAGHTPAKALEIAIEAERGDLFSQKWVSYHAALNGEAA